MQHYAEVVMDEINILKEIVEGDLKDTKGVVKFADNFKHIGPNEKNVCMIFE